MQVTGWQAAVQRKMMARQQTSSGKGLAVAGGFHANPCDGSDEDGVAADDGDSAIAAARLLLQQGSGGSGGVGGGGGTCRSNRLVAAASKLQFFLRFSAHKIRWKQKEV